MPLNFPRAPSAFFAKTPLPDEPPPDGSQPFILKKPPPIQPAAPNPYSNMPPHRMAPLGHLLQQPKFPPQFSNPAPAPYAPPQQQAADPKQAAEHFQRMNSSLPDGVRYEPIDEETLRILRQIKSDAPAAAAAPTAGPPPVATSPVVSNEAAPSAAPPAAATPAEPPSPTLPAGSAEILKELAQNEADASKFYANYNAPEGTKELFETLAAGAKLRHDFYVSLLK